MEAENEQVEKFAERVAKFCTQHGLKAMLRALVSKNRAPKTASSKLSALHFPTINAPGRAKKRTIPTSKTPPLKTILKRPENKQTKKISIDLLFRAKPLSKGYKSLYGAAFDAHKCCRKQDLHLYRHKEIYERKRLSLKDVKGWKFPKSLIAKSQLDYYVDQIQTFKGRQSDAHRVKMIVVGEEGKKKREEEKRMKEHLELEKQMKEKRDYINNQKSLFN